MGTTGTSREPIDIPFIYRRVCIRTRRRTRVKKVLTDGTYYREKDCFGSWKPPIPLRNRWPDADAIEVDMTGEDEA